LKRVWYIFKEYYLIDVVIYGGVLTFIGIGASTDNNWSLKYYLMYFGVFIPLLVFLTGSLGLLKHEVWRPIIIRKRLDLVPFIDFKMKGFKYINNHLIGEIKGYSVCVGIKWESYQKKPDYYFKVLYNPMSLKRFMTLNEFIKFNNIIEDDAYYINPSSIERSFSKRELSKYHYNDILKDINKMIDFLKLKDLNSISYDKWKDSFSKIDDLESAYLSQV
jgi:hypothetical protein